MEQASLRLPAALEPQEAPAKQAVQPRPSWRQTLREAAPELAVVGLCTAAGIAGAFLTNEAPAQEVPATPAPKVSKPNYQRIGDLFLVGGGREGVIDEANFEVGAGDRTIDVADPDQKSRKSFRSNFKVLGDRVAPPEPLKEVVHIRDRNHTFSGEFHNQPTVYPFMVYNATSQPADLQFINYALRATRYWLNENENQDLDINDHSRVRVEPNDVSHSMTLTDGIPGHTSVKGITFWSPDTTTTFIRNDGAGRQPFLRYAVATEICQSLVNVSDPRVIPGHLPQQEAMQDYTGSFNKPARHNLDLASQETICNGLGEFVAAAYAQGQKGIDTMWNDTARHAVIPATQLSEGLVVETPWLDKGLYQPDAPKFLWLARHITNAEFTEVIAARDADTPTVDFYRHHRDF